MELHEFFPVCSSTRVARRDGGWSRNPDARRSPRADGAGRHRGRPRDAEADSRQHQNAERTATRLGLSITTLGAAGSAGVVAVRRVGQNGSCGARRRRRQSTASHLPAADRPLVETSRRMCLEHGQRSRIWKLEDTPGLHRRTDRLRLAPLPRAAAAAVLRGARRVRQTASSTRGTHPGHAGGTAFRKTPVGKAFYDFYGENLFRTDLSVSVGELGSLLDHSGPVGEAGAERGTDLRRRPDVLRAQRHLDR